MTGERVGRGVGLSVGSGVGAAVGAAEGLAVVGSAVVGLGTSRGPVVEGQPGPRPPASFALSLHPNAQCTVWAYCTQEAHGRVRSDQSNSTG